jgi:hypothetical protein
MKNLICIAAICFLTATTSLMAQIKVATNGNVGINNTSPTYKLDVGGTLRVTALGASIIYDGSLLGPTTSMGSSLGSYSYPWHTLYAAYAYLYYDPIIMSDKQFKSNIADLPSMKDKLFLLRPVSYNMKSPSENSSIASNQEKVLQYGFIAQEVKEVLPELVVEREDGVLGIKYTELVPMIVQVIKEQQAEIDALKQQIADMQSKIK